MTPNLKYMTLKNRCEIEKIQNNLSLYTTGSGFFDKVFKPDYSELLFFESWNMFSEETYSLFFVTGEPLPTVGRLATGALTDIRDSLEVHHHKSCH